MVDRIMFEIAKFEVSAEERTLTGILLPFNVVSRPSINPATGRPALWTFDDGTVTVPEDPSEAVLNYGHDDQSLYMQVGAAATLSVVEGVGVQAKFNIAKTPEGDRVLALSDPSVKALKSFSAEVEGEFTTEKSDQPGMPLMRAKSVRVVGGAVVRRPAFVGAEITSVAASAAQNKEKKMTDTTVEGEAPATFSQADGDKLMEQVTEITKEIAALKDIKIPIGPGNTAQFQVKEEPIYRFAGDVGAPSGFDFATDLLAAAKDGDAAAFERLQKFSADLLNPTFADQPTTTGDTANINPAQYRPDMFLGQAPTPTSPLFDFFFKGTRTDVTPFFWSKLDRVNTDIGVSDHTEGVEPEARDLVTVVGTTVTPSAVSGKVHITREVADQGGNPQVSGLIRNEFDRSFKISLETKTAALIAAAAGSYSALATIAPGAAGNVAGLAIEGGLIDVGFRADGSRFQKMFGHVDLYKALALWENSEGEKRYPIINPQNRSGIAGDRYSFLDIAGYRMTGAASLGATSGNASNSYLADPGAVHVWNSPLQRLDKLQEKVEGWDIGVFAYFAGVVYDPTGMLKIAYDPTA